MYISIYTQTHIYIHTYIYTYIHILIYTYTYICTHTYIDTYIHTDTRTNTHIYIYIHIKKIHSFRLLSSFKISYLEIGLHVARYVICSNPPVLNGTLPFWKIVFRPPV